MRAHTGRQVGNRMTASALLAQARHPRCLLGWGCPPPSLKPPLQPAAPDLHVRSLQAEIRPSARPGWMDRTDRTNREVVETWKLATPTATTTSSASDGLTAGGMLSGGGDENIDNSGIMARESGVGAKAKRDVEGGNRYSSGVGAGAALVRSVLLAPQRKLPSAWPWRLELKFEALLRRSLCG